MAFIRLSGMFSDIKGKLNGSYFQSQKGGISMKTISPRRSGATASQKALQQSQSRLGFIARQWTSLLPAKVLLWQTFASGFTRINKNGQTYTPTAYQMFNECNLNRLSIEETIIDTPVNPSASFDVANCTIAVGEPNGMAFNSSEPIPAGKIVKISATAPQSGNKNYPRTAYKYITQVNDSEELPYLFMGLYTNVWGVPPNNMAYFFKLEVVDVASGIAEGSKLTKADAGLVS